MGTRAGCRFCLQIIAGLSTRWPSLLTALLSNSDLHSLLKIASLKISEDFLTTFQLSRESLATSVQTPAHQTPHNYRSRHLPSTKVTSPPPVTSPEVTRATPPLPSVTAVYLTIIYLNPRTV